MVCRCDTKLPSLKRSLDVALYLRGDHDAMPSGFGIVQERSQGGKTLPFEGGSAYLPRLSERCGLIQSRVQTQTCNNRDGTCLVLAAAQKVERAVATIGHDDKLTLRQPAAHEQDDLPRPIGERSLGEMISTAVKRRPVVVQIAPYGKESPTSTGELSVRQS